MIEVNALFRKSVAVFGPEGQTRKAAEECTELSLSLLHALDGRADLDNIAEEIADVEIMLAQLRIIYGSERVDGWKKVKLAALAGKLDALKI